MNEERNDRQLVQEVIVTDIDMPFYDVLKIVFKVFVATALISFLVSAAGFLFIGLPLYLIRLAFG